MYCFIKLLKVFCEYSILCQSARRFTSFLLSFLLNILCTSLSAQLKTSKLSQTNTQVYTDTHMGTTDT